MQIGGIQRFSSIDFPGNLAAVVFTVGCNFRCPFCHNPELVTGNIDLIPEPDILAFLSTRKRQLEGIVISGGEPTLQPDLPDFIEKVRALGFHVKLDTNGTRPDVLEQLLSHKMLDFVAMDIKHIWSRYAYATGLQPRDFDEGFNSINESSFNSKGHSLSKKTESLNPEKSVNFKKSANNTDTPSNHVLDEISGDINFENLVNNENMPGNCVWGNVSEKISSSSKTQELQKSVVEKIQRSVDLLLKSDIAYEFRTTILQNFHDLRDIIAISEQIRGAKRYAIQEFVSQKTLDKSFAQKLPFEKASLEMIIPEIKKNVQQLEVRFNI